MAKITKTKKRRLIKTSDKTIEKKPKTQNLKQKFEEREEREEEHPNPNQKQPQSDSDSGSVSDSDSDSSESDVENLPELLQAYTKDQLIELIVEAASKDSALFNRIRDAADGDVSHRKIFIHGLGWDTTRETLVAAFEPFGDIEECNLVLDKATGKAKGYGFVLFKTRRGAAKALKNPKKNISNRIASCQLASVGPANNNTTTSSSSFNAQSDSASRKIYVSSVPHDVDGEKLRIFFAKFGEIETGPMGFDSQTGKCKGFALFLYKTVEGAKKALEEPFKVFEGHQLQCQKAAEGSKNKNSAVAPQQGQMQQPTLAAVAAAQNMALFGQHPNLNPLYGGLMGNVGGGFVPGSANPGMVARALNPGIMGGALNPSVIPVSQVGQVGAGVGGYSGGSHGLVNLGGGSHGLLSLGGGSHGLSNPSLLGAYGTSGSLPMLQGLQHVYPNTQVQQPGSGRPQRAGGSFAGYTSYMWFFFFWSPAGL
ncbi:hypothetical protein CerSpe_216100 [Prunus speciosa]